jgi:transcriptional regulator with XRE-family HTH domain
MPLMTPKLLDYVKERLLAHVAAGGSYLELSKVVGVPDNTMRYIAQGRTKDPRVATLEAIAEYFRAHCKSRARTKS